MKKIIRTENVQHRQAGFVLVVALIIIPIIAAFTGIAFIWGQRSVMNSQLQSAVDYAAHAAAGTLCSRNDCYINSRTVAITMLQNAHIDFITDEITAAFASDTSASATHWQAGIVSIRILRGRWLEGSFLPVPESPPIPEAPLFEPFETETSSSADWQAAHTGEPVHVVANSVFVEMRLEGVSALSGVFGSLVPGMSQDFTIRAVGLAGNQGEIGVAPFAIPVCSLIDAAGNYNNTQCQYDRFITRADRYCTGGSDCDVVPGFGASIIDPAWYAGLTPSPLAHVSTKHYLIANGFSERVWSQPSDQYAVVGLPHTDSLTADEPTIVDLLNSHEAVPARIGQTYDILFSGLTTVDAATAMTNLLHAVVPSNGFVIRQNLFSSFLNASNMLVGKVLIRRDEAATAYRGMVSAPSPFDVGTCNTRFAYLNNRVTRSFGAETQYERFCNLGLDQPNIPAASGFPFEASSVGRTIETTVPVIADRRGIPCASQAGATRDPVISTAGQYVIVGFIRIVLYDYDINQSPPQPLDRIVVSGSGYSGTQMCRKYVQERTPYQFSPNGVVTRCNLVRMRTACNADLVPTIQIDGNRTPTLVN